MGKKSVLLLVGCILLIGSKVSSQVVLSEEWAQVVPSSHEVTWYYWEEEGISYMKVSVWFPTGGHGVSDWGTPAIDGNRISVSAEIWRWTGPVPLVTITQSHTYTLGALPLGDYTFIFNVWDQPVKTVTFASPTILVPDNSPTIQEAIDQAKDGDTIRVRAGTYYEKLTTFKAISLIGEDKYTTIIDGNGTGPIIKVYSNPVTIKGFTIRNSGLTVHKPSALQISASNCTIVNNILTLNGKGISLFFGGSNTIVNNTISSNYQGIYIVYSMNNTIFHNYFLNNTHQTYSTGAMNTWDNGYPSGGNYWSDYEDKYPNAAEIDESGIWNTPYTIFSTTIQQQDNYPIIPEFPSAIVLLLLLLLSTVISVLGKKLS